MSTTVTLNIPAISCGHCVATIQRETKEVPGVLTVAGDPQAKTATFTLANEAVLTDVKATLVEIGYPRGELMTGWTGVRRQVSSVRSTGLWSS